MFERWWWVPCARSINIGGSNGDRHTERHGSVHWYEGLVASLPSSHTAVSPVLESAGIIFLGHCDCEIQWIFVQAQATFISKGNKLNTYNKSLSKRRVSNTTVRTTPVGGWSGPDPRFKDHGLRLPLPHSR
jgi:hypothetical protein